MGWQVIAGSKGYEVSDAGEVRRKLLSRAGHHTLKPWLVNGYPMVRVRYVDGAVKAHLVHTLVLAAFVGPVPHGMECCHIDGQRADNRLANLRYDTRIANMADQYRHGTRVMGDRLWTAKLTLDKARKIRLRRGNGEGVRALGREFGVSHSAIRSILSGKSWGQCHVG